MRNITHPHIVALVDILESANHIHLVMEFCQLGDLAMFMKKRDTLPAHPVTADMLQSYPNPQNAGFHEVIVRHFAKQLASALEFLRSKNLVHRDLKPQNLLLNPPRSMILKERPENRPYQTSKSSLVPAAGLESLPFLKIADFGFARHLPTTTMAETLCGSPLYMAPEILRYEKYDAKADLWSVGTVLYELMVGKPPFRAANHVDLLRRIERTMDKIKFPDDLEISDGMKMVIKSLLKKMPTERMGWEAFFQSSIITADIPGLVGADRLRPTSNTVNRPKLTHRNTLLDRPIEEREPYDAKRLPRRSEGHSNNEHGEAINPSEPAFARQPPFSTQRQQRPALQSHATAPCAVQGVKNDRAAPVLATDRRRSVNPPSPGSSAPKEVTDRDRNAPRSHEKLSREARERAAQDIAFERDYVMVEKRAVEVNAFADELAASPLIQAGNRQSPTSQAGAMVRRATAQGTPISQAGQNRQVAVRPDQTHQRRPSYERKYGPSKTSAQSALAAALNMVNLRFYGGPFASSLGKGPSPPQGYGPFPAFPASAPVPLLIEDSPKLAHMDEDQKVISIMEGSATRSDVVYGFAEVKYKQLIPISPSNEHGLGIRRPGSADDIDEDDLTVDAIVSISEEALVLYVKALAILTNTINIAGNWWAQKNKADTAEASTSPRTLDPSPKTNSTAAVRSRINNVVQWARSRFNECLEKSEFVSRKLLNAQERLHSHHPSHADKKDGSSKHQPPKSDINLSSGVTAEKLMYDRALEMSKTAAVNELVNEDLPGCEVSYLTAMRLLEAVLEKEGDGNPRRGSSSTKRDKEARDDRDEDAVEGLEDGDKKTITKRKPSPPSLVSLTLVLTQSPVIESMKTRLLNLRKKMAMQAALLAKREQQQQQQKVSPSPSPKETVAVAPVVSSATPPR